MGTEERAIRDVHSSWIAAVNAGDLVRLLHLMADDVVFLNPGQAPFGRDGFSANFSAAQQQVRIHCSSELEDVTIAGEVAYTWSRDALSVTPRAGGEATRLAGHRITVYRKQPDGRWLLARDAHTLSPAGPATGRQGVDPSNDREESTLSNEQGAPGTKGVSVKLLATVDLGPEIEGLAGRQLRMRMVTIEPGGVFGPLHDHKGRPGIVYVLQGTITDHRDGVATEYGPGVGWPEDRNTLHWLENRGTIPAVEISVDIVTQE